ncbi:MAG: TRAP transporter substrate-binding protein [Parvibaculales bacterium]
MSKKINRRKILAGAAGLAAGTTAFKPAAPAYAKGKRRLKQVTTWPKNFPGLGTAPENIAKRVEAMSDGELKIKIFAAGELVGALEAFDAVSTGTADMYNGAEYYWQGKDPVFAFFTTWPFGMTAVEFAAWIEFGGGQQLWDELTARFNIKSFLSADSGTQSGGWFNKPINTVEDFKGLKMRMPGLGGEVLRRLGALPVVLPGSELYAAMQSGAIDASEWVGPWNDMAIGFHQVGKYFYSPGFHEPNAALATGINLEVWNSLSATHQAILKTACQAEAHRTNAQYFYNNAKALRDLKAKHGISPQNFPEEVMTALREKSGEVMQEIAGRSDIAKRVYDSAMSAMSLYREWSPYAEEGYLKHRS